MNTKNYWTTNGTLKVRSDRKNLVKFLKEQLIPISKETGEEVTIDSLWVESDTFIKTSTLDPDIIFKIQFLMDATINTNHILVNFTKLRDPQYHDIPSVVHFNDFSQKFKLSVRDVEELSKKYEMDMRFDVVDPVLRARHKLDVGWDGEIYTDDYDDSFFDYQDFIWDAPHLNTFDIQPRATTLDVEAEEFDSKFEGHLRTVQLILAIQKYTPHGANFDYTSEYRALSTNIIESNEEYLNTIFDTYHGNEYIRGDSTQHCRQNLLLILDYYGVYDHHLKIDDKLQAYFDIYDEVYHNLNNKGYYGTIDHSSFIDRLDIKITDQALQFEDKVEVLKFYEKYETTTADDLKEFLSKIKQLPNIKGELEKDEQQTTT